MDNVRAARAHLQALQSAPESSFFGFLNLQPYQTMELYNYVGTCPSELRALEDYVTTDTR